MNGWVSWEEKRVLSYQGMATNKCRREGGARQSPTLIVRAAPGKTFQTPKYDEKLDICRASVHLTTRCFLIWKGQKQNFPIEKPGRHHLKQVMKGDINNNGAPCPHTPPGMEGIALLLWHPCLCHQATADKRKSKNVLQKNWPECLQMSNSWKRN